MTNVTPFAGRAATDVVISARLLRRMARTAVERALLARLEVTAFFRSVREISWRGADLGQIVWFEHKAAGLPAGCLEGVMVPTTPWAVDRLQAWGADAALAKGPHTARFSVASEQTGDLAPEAQQRDVLEFASDYEQSLMAWGKHTRRNMRNIRKRAAQEGYTFDRMLGDAPCSNDEIRALAKRNFPHAYSLQRAQKNERYVSMTGRAFRTCIRGPNGALVSYCAGVLDEHGAILIYQLNDSAAHDLSPSLLHRAHLIEWLIGEGAKELIFVGGCKGILEHACTPMGVEQKWVTRRTLGCWASAKAATLTFLRRFVRESLKMRAQLIADDRRAVVSASTGGVFENELDSQGA